MRPLKEKSPQQKAQEKKRARRAAQQRMANAPESRWMRPGGPLQPSRRPAPIFGEGQPRHIRIDDTPHVIIPHVTVGPTQNDDGTQGPLMHVLRVEPDGVNGPEQQTQPTGHASYQRNLPATKIKPVEVDAPASLQSRSDIKSNRTMPMKRIE